MTCSAQLQPCTFHSSPLETHMKNTALKRYSIGAVILTASAVLTVVLKWAELPLNVCLAVLGVGAIIGFLFQCSAFVIAKRSMDHLDARFKELMATMPKRNRPRQLDA